MVLYTKTELDKLQKERFAELLELVGGSPHLAAMIGVKQNVTGYWARAGRISPEGAKMVEKHPRLGEKFTLEYLRPEFETVDSQR